MTNNHNDNKNREDFNEQDFNNKVDSLGKRINNAQKNNMDHVPDQTEHEKNRSVGMNAGSNFIGSVIGGGIAGYGIGYIFGNIPLWLILFMFAGFGWGIYRAAKIMQ